MRGRGTEIASADFLYLQIFSLLILEREALSGAKFLGFSANEFVFLPNNIAY